MQFGFFLFETRTGENRERQSDRVSAGNGGLHEDDPCSPTMSSSSIFVFFTETVLRTASPHCYTFGSPPSIHHHPSFHSLRAGRITRFPPRRRRHRRHHYQRDEEVMRSPGDVPRPQEVRCFGLSSGATAHAFQDTAFSVEDGSSSEFSFYPLKIMPCLVYLGVGSLFGILVLVRCAQGVRRSFSYYA